MLQITLRGTSEGMVILGTNGEKAIISGLKLLSTFGEKEQRDEASNLLKLMGKRRQDN